MNESFFLFIRVLLICAPSAKAILLFCCYECDTSCRYDGTWSEYINLDTSNGDELARGH